MHKMNYLSNTEGHTVTKWKPGERSEAKAHAEFNRIMARSGLAYKVTEKKNEQIREFDPNAETIIVHEQLQGG